MNTEDIKFFDKLKKQNEELLKQNKEMRDMLKKISECLQNGDAFPVYKIEILLESTEVKP